ncbi:MAG: GIY-YIG nuclease family protein [Candidatus Omnitrophota bacterium]
MVYYVYVLKNDQGRYYMGSTKDIELRLRQHNQNSVRSTKNKGPFKLVYKEIFGTRTEARKRENQVKGYKNSDYTKRLVKK